MRSGSVVFDRYRLEEQIGAGGTGVVWRAADLLLEMQVALKRVSSVGADDAKAALTQARTLREARIAARLRRHPHVVAIHDVLIGEGDVWLVLEYLPAHSLSEMLRRAGPLDPVAVARIGAQVADALAAGHALGIEHRDVTPSNVLIADDGVVKLTDFGISRLNGDTRLTEEGMLNGTIAYLAPEVANTGESSASSDVFSLGSTLYAAVEGQPPFGASDNVMHQLNLVRTGIISPPAAAGPLEPLLLRLLQLDPATRPDAATARDLLNQFVSRAGAPGESSSPLLDTGPPGRRAARWFPRRRLRIALLAVVVGAVLGVGTALVVPTLGGPDLPPAGGSAPPVGPIALTGDPRAADPCALIDLESLRQFGRPSFTVNYEYDECRAGIKVPTGEFQLNVSFDKPLSSPADLDGQLQQLGELTIARQGLQPMSDPSSVRCQNTLLLVDRTPIYIQATSYSAPRTDQCALAEVGTATAVSLLARNGISYRPDRTAGSPLAHNDACTVLDTTALTAVGLDPSSRFPGFANWSCRWSSADNGNAGDSKALLEFQTDDVRVNDYGNPTPIAGKPGWLDITDGDKGTRSCDARVLHRFAPSSTALTELLHVNVKSAAPDDQLCAEATTLVEAAEAKLPPA